MMSLTEVSLSDVVQKQYVYKLKAYYPALTSMVIIQLMAILLSLGGVGMYGSGRPGLDISVHYYSVDLVIGLTMFWVFVTSILVTTKTHRLSDFTFVANRLSSHLSNGIFLLTASIIGGVTAMLSEFLLKVIIYFIRGIEFIQINFPTLQEWTLGLGAACLYMMLFSVLGYFCGLLVQLNRMFVVLLPGMIVGLLIWGAKLKGGEGNAMIEFFGAEPSFFLLLLKVVTVAGLLFASASALSNRLEVK